MSLHHLRLHAHRCARVRRATYERDGWQCIDWDRAGRLEAHHVAPLHKGGASYDLASIETLCRSCHIDRHRRNLTLGEAAWWARLPGA